MWEVVVDGPGATGVMASSGFTGYAFSGSMPLRTIEFLISTTLRELRRSKWVT